MPTYSILDIILVRYPFSDLSSSKVRPAIVVSPPHPSQDLLIVPLTSKTDGLLPGEFLLAQWKKSGLLVPSVVKRGIYTVDSTIVIKRVGSLTKTDAELLVKSLKAWLGLEATTDGKSS